MSYTNTLHKFIAEINEKFSFEQSPQIVLGVSGGPDSLALALLTKHWIDKIGGKLICLTVNHNLRPESENEAAYTSKLLKKYNIEHHILDWEGTKKKSNLQDQARKARISLLTNWCLNNKIKHLFLAHTQDDEVETFFMRLFRGSGLQGLSSIQHISEYNSVNIIHPLLNFKKEELERFLSEQDIKWITDPSNNNDQFLRVKIRKFLKSEIMNDIIPYTLMLDRCKNGIDSIKRANDLIEKQKNKIISEIIELHPEGYLTIKYSEFAKIPMELSLNILASCLITISGKHFYRPRFESLKLLYKHILSHSKKAITLWECEVKIKKNLIFIYHEVKKTTPPISIIDKNTIKWDNRFIIKYPNISKELNIVRFNSKIYSQNKEILDISKYEDIPKKILYSLPTLMINNTIYVPFLTKQRISEINIYFSPSIPLAKNAFSN